MRREGNLGSRLAHSAFVLSATNVPVLGQTGRVANKTYAQWCPVSLALDIIGERWTLLIVRDLWFGLRRFSELEAELTGISPSLLSSRLRQLTDAKIIEQVGGRYQLTERGADLLDVINEIGRWGIGLMEKRSDDLQYSDFFPRAAVGFLARPEVLPDRSFVAELHLDDRVLTLRVAEASADIRPSRRISVHDGPATGTIDVRVDGSLDDLRRYRQGTVLLTELLAVESFTIEGSPEARTVIGRVFSAT